MSSASSAKLTVLSAELRGIAIAGFAGLILIGASMSYIWDRTAALHWLILASLIGSVVYYLGSRRLDLNRIDPAMPLYPTLGMANRLTVARGGLIAATGGFLFLEWPPGMLAWLPGCLYTLAAILDRIDGFVARRTRHTSLLGIELDTLFDALGLAVAPLLAVWYGQIHWSYLLFSIAFYLFQWGIYWRERNHLPVYPLAPNILRRTWAGFQMGFIGVVLFPLFKPPLTQSAGIAFVLPVLIGFLIDWLTVSGRLNRTLPAVTRFFYVLEGFGQNFFQPVLRILVLVILLTIIESPFTLLESAMLLAAVLVMAGINGRVFALGLILLLGLYYRSNPLGISDQLLVFAIVWIMLLGTGRFSLWLADERWINRHDGA